MRDRALGEGKALQGLNCMGKGLQMRTRKENFQERVDFTLTTVVFHLERDLKGKDQPWVIDRSGHESISEFCVFLEYQVFGHVWNTAAEYFDSK